MTRLKASSGQFGLIGGICRATSDCILAVEPSPVSPAARSKGNLYILAEPVLEAGRGYQTTHQVLEDISEAYYACTSPSVTTCLGRALREANQGLLQRNLEVSGHEKLTIGVTCAVVHGEELFLAQILPGQAYLVHQGHVQAFPLSPSWSPEATTLPVMTKLQALGWAEEAAIEFFHSPLAAGDVFCLSSSNIGRLLGREDAEQVLLYQEPGDVVEQLYRRVHQQGFSDAHAVVVEMRLATVKPSAPFFSRAGLRERAKGAAGTMGAWGGFLLGEARRTLRRPKTAGRKKPRIRPARQQPAAPPPPEIPSLARPKPAGPWWKTLGEQVRALFHPQERFPRLERPRLRIRPAKEKRRLTTPLLLVAAALLVLAALVGLVARQSQHRKDTDAYGLITQAEQQVVKAMETRDNITETNRLLDQAATLLEQASENRRARARAELVLADLGTKRDQVNQVTRFAPDGLVQLVTPAAFSETVAAAGFAGGCTQGCLLRDLVVVGKDIFLLEQQRGTVYISTTKEMKALLGPGSKGSPTDHPILAIARLDRPANCDPDQAAQSWLAAVDANRQLYLYRQGQWESYDLAIFGGSSWKGRSIDLEGYQGNVYVLRGDMDQILKYPCGAYETNFITWLQEDPRSVKVESALDMTIDGSIYLLMGDGSVLQLQRGVLQHTLSYQVYPADLSPTYLYTDPASAYIYVADRRGGRIIQLRKEGEPSFIRQLRGPKDEDLRDLRAVVLREDQGLFYILTGSTLYRGTLPMAPTLSPTPSPTRTP